MLAFIVPLDNSGAPGSPSQPIAGTPPGTPSQPIVLPPLPGIWPKPGHPNLPIDPAFGVGGGPHPGGGPILIPEPLPPDNQFPVPPGQIWPPLPPTTSGKYALLIVVVGVGYRWLIVDAEDQPQPK